MNPNLCGICPLSPHVRPSTFHRSASGNGQSVFSLDNNNRIVLPPPRPTHGFSNGYASPVSYPSTPKSEGVDSQDDRLQERKGVEVGTSQKIEEHANEEGKGAGDEYSDGENDRQIYELKGCYGRHAAVNRGWQLNDISLLRTVGTGTFGRVYLARVDLPKPQFLALKVLSKSACVKLRQVEHINSERYILSSIRHPFIVQLLQTFQTPSHLFMCLEYVMGGEVFSHLRRQTRFHNDVAKFYTGSIVLAVEYLHQNDIVYRDLKPENLLLDRDGYVKIVDFGFAKRVTDRTYTVCGTPEYLAPEIIVGEGHTKAVDWWALGILTFEMLIGYPPYYDNHPLRIYEKITEGNLIFPSHVTLEPAAQDLIQRLLKTDLSQRLGNLKNGANDVKNHPFFAGFDWNGMLEKRYAAPFVPEPRFEGDTRYFENYEELGDRFDGCDYDETDQYGKLFVGF